MDMGGPSPSLSPSEGSVEHRHAGRMARLVQSEIHHTVCYFYSHLTFEVYFYVGYFNPF